jgi:GT2 family glycosyltransferase
MIKKISAVIVNYNAGEYLRKCINSLITSPNVHEIIIIDNASIDDSLDGLQGMPRVSIIRNLKNFGFAAACNQGLQYSSTGYVLFSNPDCVFSPDTLTELLKSLESTERVGMVGGLLTNPDGTEQGGGRRAVPTPWRSFVRAFGLNRLSNRWPKVFFDFHLHKEPLPSSPIEVEAISGACMLIKRKASEEVGLWDEGYFLHCEDLDWCMRFRQKNWSILFVPSARVTHAHGACSKTRPIFVAWHKHRGMVRFYRKFFQHQYPGLLMNLVILGVWLRFCVLAGYYLTGRLLRLLRLRSE